MLQGREEAGQTGLLSGGLGALMVNVPGDKEGRPMRPTGTGRQVGKLGWEGSGLQGEHGIQGGSKAEGGAAPAGGVAVRAGSCHRLVTGRY